MIRFILSVMLRVGIIGFGYWGPHLVRNFHTCPDSTVVRIADLDEKRRSQAQNLYPGIEVVSDPESVLHGTDLDAVAIAVPVSQHHALAKEALLSGKHVWIEKPMASTAAQATELAQLSEDKGLILMVDHTFLFTGAVRKMRELVRGGELGEIYYYDSVRVNLGLFQHDVNVIWDLAPHDLSIMDYIIDAKPVAVSAQGQSHFGTGLEDVAYLSVHYENNLMAHFHFNWLSPVKIRRTLIGGSNKMLLWDDLKSEEKLKIYDKGVEITSREGTYKLLSQYRTGDVHTPNLDPTEALVTEAAYFIRCIRTGERPHNDGRAGTRIVSILEAADESLRSQGKLCRLKEVS